MRLSYLIICDKNRLSAPAPPALSALSVPPALSALSVPPALSALPAFPNPPDPSDPSATSCSSAVVEYHHGGRYLFRAFDVDGNGVITFPEFVRALWTRTT